MEVRNRLSSLWQVWVQIGTTLGKMFISFFYFISGISFMHVIHIFLFWLKTTIICYFINIGHKELVSSQHLESNWSLPATMCGTLESTYTLSWVRTGDCSPPSFKKISLDNFLKSYILKVYMIFWKLVYMSLYLQCLRKLNIAYFSSSI